MRVLIPVLVGMFFLHASPVMAQKQLHVPSVHATIQAAIDAAKPSDEVVVAPGTYYENIDFKGKAITVRSARGPLGTTINGGRRGPAVRFASGETRAAVLQGFTVTGGRPGVDIQSCGPTVKDNVIRLNESSAFGGGIRCYSTLQNRAVILNNRILQNIAQGGFMQQCSGGGGIFCQHAIVVGNVIAQNRVSGLASTSWVLDMRGGGIYSGESLLTNNIIERNSVDIPWPSMLIVTALGGGIYSSGDDEIIHDTVVANAVASIGNTRPHIKHGGGISAPATTRVGNSIVRLNTATGFPQIHGNPVVAFSNVEGGAAGNGNIDVVSLFTGDGSYHLLHGSPDRNRGSNQFLNLAASDFEWDTRGYENGHDLGADEFAPHLYSTGESRVGKTFEISLTGNPGAPVLLAYAARTIDPPITVPGTGTFYLHPGTAQIMNLGVFPASGVISVPISIATGSPTGTVPFQALIGTRLTNLLAIEVHP